MDVRKAIADELHKQARRNYPRRRVTLKGINDLYQADLVEMQPYSRANKGYRYIMTIINCLTKFAFAVPLKDKTGAEVAKALDSICSAKKMINLQTDDGKEWFNKDVAKVIKKHKINHYSTYSEVKASIVERFNRTLKTRMWKYFTARGTHEWLDILPEIIKSYNNTKHRSIGMKPKDVRKKHVNDILQRIYKKDKSKKYKPKFRVGDNVRISKIKRTFTKGYLPNWTNEVYRIFAVKPTIPPTYILQDSKGEILRGGFYEQEISLSKTGDVYLVEKILRRKGDRVLVRWLGFDKSHDEWVHKDSIK
jgi:L-rhamnose mutarotase